MVSGYHFICNKVVLRKILRVDSCAEQIYSGSLSKDPNVWEYIQITGWKDLLIDSIRECKELCFKISQWFDSGMCISVCVCVCIFDTWPIFLINEVKNTLLNRWGSLCYFIFLFSLEIVALYTCKTQNYLSSQMWSNFSEALSYWYS